MDELEYLRSQLNKARMLLARNAGVAESNRRLIAAGVNGYWTPTDQQILDETNEFLATVKSWPQSEDLANAE